MRKTLLVAWLPPLFLYIGFLAWYDGWGRGPLTDAEVRGIEQRLAARPDVSEQTRASMAEFLRTDDGGEFLMLNLVKLEQGDVLHPVSREVKPAMDVLMDYFEPYMASALPRACHPAWNGRILGGRVESWQVAPDPGWHVASLIRYRSRRDLFELVLNPEFDHLHQFKELAIQSTWAAPTGAVQALLLSPRGWVGLCLALLAALAHLVLLSRRPGN